MLGLRLTHAQAWEMVHNTALAQLINLLEVKFPTPGIASNPQLIPLLPKPVEGGP